ncbi:MAG: flagellar type III secretion system pore protein FliP [Pseudomonadota bacterium]
MIRLTLLLAMLATPSHAQVPDITAILDGSEGRQAANIISTFGLVAILSLAPAILVVVTSFTRFIIAFSILRMGLGLQTTPANLILISLSLFMTFHVMAPVLDRAYAEGIEPLSRGEISQSEGIARAVAPFRGFMLEHVRAEDLDLFVNLAATRDGAAPTPAAREDVSLRSLLPAFLISEIRRGFEIGFLILLPFLVIDLVVATIVMAMGMMMLPPTVVSLPFKVLFFVLIDGWNLLVGSMVRSFL